MDSNLLSIELSINHDGKLIVTDTTEYEDLQSLVYNYAAIERLVDFDENVVEERYKVLTQQETAADFRKEDPYDLPKDGFYEYQKLLIPTEDYVGTAICYFNTEDEKFYLNNEVVEFDDIWAIKSEETALFWYDKGIFSIYNLIECFVRLEKKRLDEFFKNGCNAACISWINGSNADFLAGAIFVLNHMIDNNNFTQAQLLLNRLQTCNGLCGDIMGNDDSNGCGCGTIV